MHAAAPDLSADLVRDLLQRRDIAVAAHRGALARRLGVADSEMLALVHLAQVGEATTSALGQALRLSSGGATALVQRLERSGYVVRARHPRDRRSSLLRLAPAVARMVAEADEAMARHVARIAAELGVAEQAVVAGFLARLAEASEALVAGEREPEEAPLRLVPSLWS